METTRENGTLVNNDCKYSPTALSQKILGDSFKLMQPCMQQLGKQLETTRLKTLSIRKLHLELG